MALVKPICLTGFEFLEQEVSEKEVLNAQMEASCALVEKLVAENADLVEKVNRSTDVRDGHAHAEWLTIS